MTIIPVFTTDDALDTWAQLAGGRYPPIIVNPRPGLMLMARFRVAGSVWDGHMRIGPDFRYIVAARPGIVNIGGNRT